MVNEALGLRGRQVDEKRRQEDRSSEASCEIPSQDRDIILVTFIIPLQVRERNELQLIRVLSSHTLLSCSIQKLENAAPSALFNIGVVTILTRRELLSVLIRLEQSILTFFLLLADVEFGCLLGNCQHL